MSKKTPFRHRHELDVLPNTPWGIMYMLGLVAPGIPEFRVEFFDNAAHGWHRHPRHAEMIYVLKGAIEQKILIESMIFEATIEEGGTAEIPLNAPHTARPLDNGTVVLVTLAGNGDDYYAEPVDPPPADSGFGEAA
jgi:quercetin dioxygenase-like cupin family protein